MTVENFIELAYSLLKDKLNIAKLTFTSGANGATQEYLLGSGSSSAKPKKRCPDCGIEMTEAEAGYVCYKCGYKENKKAVK
jgi:6-pyruvoyltetrahydropterin/6-carboxytetrahydropterin synthase